MSSMKEGAAGEESLGEPQHGEGRQDQSLMSQAQPAGEEKNGGMPAAYSGEIALRRE